MLLRKMIQYLHNLISCIFPPTRLFAFKRSLFRLLGVSLENDVKIGDCIKLFLKGSLNIQRDVWVGRGCEFYIPRGAKMHIGNKVDIGPNVHFMCGSHEISNHSQRAGPGMVADLIIGNGVWIGGRSTILGGVVLGNGVVVAAGSLVLPGEYPDDVLLAGVPAEVKRSLK